MLCVLSIFPILVDKRLGRGLLSRFVAAVGCAEYGFVVLSSSMLKSLRQLIEEKHCGLRLQFILGALLAISAGSFASTCEVQAGLIVCASDMVDSAGSGASAGAASSSQGLPIPFAGYFRRAKQSAHLLLSGHDGSSSGAGVPPGAESGFSTSAIAGTACMPPPSAMVAWLQFGQHLALPPLLPSGLFRPPRVRA